MAILKLTKSKKAVLFFSDEGGAYITSVSMLRKVISGDIGIPILLLTRLPIPVDVTRFKKSPVYENGIALAANDKDFNTMNDGLGKNRLRKQEDMVQYSDKDVW